MKKTKENFRYTVRSVQPVQPQTWHFVSRRKVSTGPRREAVKVTGNIKSNSIFLRNFYKFSKRNPVKN